MADQIPQITNSKDVGISTLGDDADLLNDDTPPEPKGDEKPKGSENEEEEIDEEELKLLEDKNEDERSEDKDEEVEGDEEEVNEEEGTVSRPSIRDIVKKIPEAAKVFKEFPELRAAYYNEGKYREIFSTPKEAEIAADKATSLDTFDNLLKQGSSRELLEAIGKDDRDALKNLVENFLPTVQELDKGLFSEVVTPVINTVIRNLHRVGERDKDNNMMAAAKILSKFIHGSYDIPEGKSNKVDPEIDKERKKLEDERRSDFMEKGKSFEKDVHTRAARLVTKFISDGLDPRGELSDFNKSAIIEAVIDRLGTHLESDRAYQQLSEKLWKASAKARFSNESAESIITAYLSRAKRLIPEIRAKVKAEAAGKRTKESNNGRKTTREVETGTRSRGESRGKTENDPKKVDWRKVSDRQLLED